VSKRALVESLLKGSRGIYIVELNGGSQDKNIAIWEVVIGQPK
jgi:hypothetical protein